MRSKIPVAPTLLFLVVLATCFRYGLAVICYQCNSEYDPRCGDPFDPYSLGTVNCSFQPRLEHLNNIEPTICRKISQKVYGKTRVVRGCGFLEDEKADNKACLIRSGTHDVRAFYCSCTTDLCNGAEARPPQFGLITIISLITILLSANRVLSRTH